jgi:hypothetical protein
MSGGWGGNMGGSFVVSFTTGGCTWFLPKSDRYLQPLADQPGDAYLRVALRLPTYPRHSLSWSCACLGVTYYICKGKYKGLTAQISEQFGIHHSQMYNYILADLS